VASVN